MAKAPSLKSTQEVSPSRAREEVVKEAIRIEEALLFSSKAHFAACRFWTNFHLWIGIPMVLLSAIAGASALSQFDPHHIVAGVLAIIVAALSGVATFVNANEKASVHLNAGNNYDSVMNAVRIFHSIDCWGDDSDEVLTERLKRFSEKKDDINKSSPPIPKFAYQSAKKGIEDGEGTYSVDAK